jgi:hypothetical protein
MHPKFTLWVTAPVFTIETLVIPAPLPRPSCSDVPVEAVAGALVMLGRAARLPPALNRYGGE